VCRELQNVSYNYTVAQQQDEQPHPQPAAFTATLPSAEDVTLQEPTSMAAEIQHHVTISHLHKGDESSGLLQ